MYRLTILVIVSSAIPQLVGAARRRGSPSSRGNLYFDSYDHPYTEEFDDSGEELRGAVLMHPEEVLEIPPISQERYYEKSDFGTDGSVDDYPDDIIWNSTMDTSRGIIHDFLEQVQAAFSTWPPKIPGPPEPRGISYYLDESLEDHQREDLKSLLKNVEEKTCLKLTESEENPDVIFMGTRGCTIDALRNRILIGYDCFLPKMIYKLFFKRTDICSKLIPTRSKSSGLYVDHFRSKNKEEDDSSTECSDNSDHCRFMGLFAQSPEFCRSYFHGLARMCPRTCRVCGDNCVDHDPDCTTSDTVKDCLLNWNRKRFGCANTCGVCKSPKRAKLCIDFVNCCRDLAKNGYCPKFPDLMKEYCAKSCGFCKPSFCADERSDCSELKRLGGCKKMPGLMEKICPKTCNLCENEVRKRENYEISSELCSADMAFVGKFCDWDQSHE